MKTANTLSAALIIAIATATLVAPATANSPPTSEDVACINVEKYLRLVPETCVVRVHHEEQAFFVQYHQPHTAVCLTFPATCPALLDELDRGTADIHQFGIHNEILQRLYAVMGNIMCYICNIVDVGLADRDQDGEYDGFAILYDWNTHWIVYPFAGCDIELLDGGHIIDPACQLYP